MRDLVRHQILIVLATALVLLVNLGRPRLWDDDEPRNATCAAEMLARGDWIVPTFNGQLRTDKPILLYWFTLAAYHVLGVTEFAARATSAVFGIGTVLLTYHLGRRMFGASVGLWAGILLSSSVMFGVASRAATPDSLLIFFSTLAVWFFVSGSFMSDAVAVDGIVGLPRHWSSYFQMYGAMSLAVLAKGPVGLVLPTGVVVLYLLALNPVPLPPRRDLSGRLASLRQTAMLATTWLVRTFWPGRIARFAWRLRPLTALSVVAVVALPWYVVVGIETAGQWPMGFLWRHNVERFAAPMEGHSGPPFYHLLSIAAGFFPASVFLVPMAICAVQRLRAEDPSRRGCLLAVCWITVYVVVFSLAGTKLPSYVTPTYPALALLTGALFHDWLSQPRGISRFWQGAALGVFGLSGVGMSIGVALMANRYLPGEEPLGLLGVVPACGGAVCLALFARGKNRPAAVAFVAFATLFSTGLFGWALVRVDRYQNAAPLAALIDENSAGVGRPRVCTFRTLQPSWVFYLRQQLPAANNVQEASAVFTSNEGPGFLIADASQLITLQPYLPADVRVLGRFSRFLRPGEIAVLGRPPSDNLSAAGRTASTPDFSRRR